MTAFSKYFYVIFILATLWVGCKNGKSESKENIEDSIHLIEEDTGLLVASSSNIKSDSLKKLERKVIKKFVSEFGGIWIDTSYIFALKKSNSPFYAQKESPYYLVYISDKHISDTTIGVYGYSQGHAEACLIEYHKINRKSELSFVNSKFPGETKFSSTNPSGCDSTFFVFDENDTVMVRKGNSSSDRSYYLTRLNTEDLEDNFLIEITRLLATILLKGDYELYNSSYNLLSDSLSIDRDGWVTGYPNFSRMVIWGTPAELHYPFDVVNIITDSLKDDWYDVYSDNNYKYEKSNDTITLIQTEYSDSLEFEGRSPVLVKEPIYYLIKKK